MAAKKKVVTKKKSGKKSPNYSKKISELEKKLGEMSETMGAQKEFIDGASRVINTLAYTPELKEAWDKYGYPKATGQVRGEQEKQETVQRQEPRAPQSPTDDVAKRVEGVETAQREEIIASFEKAFGIDQLKDKQKKETRTKVETFLRDFGWSARNIPLPQLRASLEKAYIGTHAEKLKEEGKLEGIAQARTNQMGAMGTMSGTAPETHAEEGLTEAQREWVRKLGVDEKKATKTYLARSEEETRVPKGENAKK